MTALGPFRPTFGKYLIVQIDTERIQTALLAFIASSSTLIRRSEGRK
jgi:hypothetical protein